MKRIVVIGATSAIAKSVIKRVWENCESLCLVAHDPEKLENLCTDLRARGYAGELRHILFDAADAVQCLDVIKSIFSAGPVDLLFIAHGSLPDQSQCERDTRLTLREIQINALSAITILNEAAPYFERQQHGRIAVIGSVAGDRGRPSNFVYGTAKGMLEIYLQGLRARLYKSGVSVLTVKPGFVDTPMTAAFAKSRLWAQPDTVAKQIVGAIRRGQNVLYTPRRWFWIMAVIKMIPEMIFKRFKM